jgi:aminopeptidase N
MSRVRVGVAGLAVVAVALAGCTEDRPTSARPDFRPGAEGAGDPYFPTYGNGGYDVAGYDLKLKYEPATGRLTGTATITATATQDLSRFDLDLAHLTAGAVTVDGTAATAEAKQNELVITPRAGLSKGKPFTVVVAYGGKPEALRNPALGQGGWLRTRDGAFALGQPESASTWFPVNDHPSDKAAFKLAMTVPDGVEAISNGVPGRRESANGWSTWTWTESAPMASYLTTVVIGRYRITSTTHDGKPLVIAVPDTVPADAPAVQSLARTGEITDFLATQFGPYPFDAYGGIVLDDLRVGYALETQSRPAYGITFFRGGPNTVVVAHELAHQWFGDSVALERWQDIWLNEGFATYAEWLWLEHEGRQSVEASFDRAYNGYHWTEPALDPGTAHLFGAGAYQRGAMTLQALRRTIGDPAFFGLLKSWPAEHRNGNGTTGEFIAAAQTASGKDLGSFFETWLSGTTKPPHP